MTLEDKLGITSLSLAEAEGRISKKKAAGGQKPKVTMPDKPKSSN